MGDQQPSEPRRADRSEPVRVGGELPSRRSAEHRRAARERHAVPSWYVWSLQELLRACYAILVLALIMFGSLQIEYSLLPDGLPPVAEPALVGGSILVFIIVSVVAAVYGYLFFWKEGGWVDRAVDRHLHAQRATSEKSREP